MIGILGQLIEGVLRRKLKEELKWEGAGEGRGWIWGCEHADEVGVRRERRGARNFWMRNGNGNS